MRVSFEAGRWMKIRSLARELSDIEVQIVFILTAEGSAPKLWKNTC